MRTTPNRFRTSFFFNFLIVIPCFFVLQSFNISGGERITAVNAPLEIASVNINPVSCFNGANGSITITAAGGTAPYTYQWSPSGGTGATASLLRSGNYTCTVKDALGEEIVSSVITVTEPTKLTAIAGATQDVTCAVFNGAATMDAPTGGTAPYSYIWYNILSHTPISQGTLSITGLIATNYYAEVTDAKGCVDTAHFMIRSQMQDVESAAPVGTDTHFETGCNEPMAALQSSGGNPVTGTITAKLFVRDEALVSGPSVYLRRSYEITPAINPTTATARITLYYFQEDFDDFNSSPVSTYDLPTGPSDEIGKANFRIIKYSGASFNGTGLPSTYAPSPTVINPEDDDIVWNSTDNRWEISFDVSGFSGFFVQAVDNVTPLRFISFTGILKNNEALLEWKTDNEINTSSFDIERSIDGRNFSKIGTLFSNNLPGVQRYRFIDISVPKQNTSTIYYRIKQKDLDGAFTFSAIVPLSVHVSAPDISISPNPANSRYAILSIGLIRSENLELNILNSNGSMVQRYKYDLSAGNSVLPIDISRLSKGLYYIRVQGETTNKIIKLVRL